MDQYLNPVFNANNEIAPLSDDVLTTYSAKESVRRTLQQTGFTIERLPAPTGKQEMLRAVK